MVAIFVLGAGFSKAVSEEMPLLSELSTQIRQRPIDLPPALSTLGDNLELWLSYLSQPHPWLPQSSNLKNQAAGLEITECLREILNEREQLAIVNECPVWLQRLTHYWHENESSVITFNYDTLIERAASLIQISERFNLVPGQLYPVQLTLASRRDAMVFGAEIVDTFTLYKLHGSVNWFYSGITDSTGEIIYYTNVGGWETDATNYQHRQETAVRDKVPFIVPPTTEKVGFFKHESLKQIWTRAVMSLADADEVYICGYSLPMTDLAVRLFLCEGGTSVAHRKRLYIVNRDCGVVSRYYELLGDAFDINESFVGDNAVELLVENLLD